MKDDDMSPRAAFSVPNIHLLQGAALLFASLAFSCAGKTTSDPPLSSCGSSCGVEQISSSCSSTCTKLIQTGCYKDPDAANCTQSCIKFGNATKCPKAIEFLRCAESVTPTCVAGDPDFGPTCSALLKEADKCSGGPQPEPVGMPPGGTGGGPGDPVPVVDDPAICPNIPRRAVGGGACAGTSGGSEGPDAAPSCTRACQDSTGSLWEATCSGNTCACSYNGSQMCTCTITVLGNTACASCCPGTT